METDSRTSSLLVCGIDISESTALKIQHPMSGDHAILSFMERFDESLRSLDRDADSASDAEWFLWRVRGDELVYLRCIPAGDDGNPNSESIVDALQEFIVSVQTVSSRLVADLSFSLNLRAYAFILHSQGNLWDYRWHLMPKELGEALKNKDKLECMHGNLEASSLRDIQKDYFIDFIGFDVDLGFRVAEQSEAHRMILSPYLAYLVMVGLEKNEISPFSIYSMGERELKGCSIKETGLVEYPLYYVPIGNFSILEEPTGEPIQINISKEIEKLEDFEKFRNDSYRFIYEKALKHISADES